MVKVFRAARTRPRPRGEPGEPRAERGRPSAESAVFLKTLMMRVVPSRRIPEHKPKPEGTMTTTVRVRDTIPSRSWRAALLLVLVCLFIYLFILNDTHKDITVETQHHKPLGRNIRDRTTSATAWKWLWCKVLNTAASVSFIYLFSFEEEDDWSSLVHAHSFFSIKHNLNRNVYILSFFFGRSHSYPCETFRLDRILALD